MSFTPLIFQFFSVQLFSHGCSDHCPTCPQLPSACSRVTHGTWVTRSFIHAPHQGHRRLCSLLLRHGVQGALGLGSSETLRTHPFGKEIAQPPRCKAPKALEWNSYKSEVCVPGPSSLFSPSSHMALGLLPTLPSVRTEGACWARQAPLSVGSSRQEYWSGLPFPSPGDLPNPGMEPRSPTLQADSWLSGPPGKPHLREQLWVLNEVTGTWNSYTSVSNSL